MTNKELIEILQQCDPTAPVHFNRVSDDCFEDVDFVECQLSDSGSQEIFLLDTDPNWENSEDSDLVEVLERKPKFIQTKY